MLHNPLGAYNPGNIAPLAQVLQEHVLSSALTSPTLHVSHLPIIRPEDLRYQALFMISSSSNSGTRLGSTGSITFWSMVEVSVGVTCACLPTLPPLLGVLGRKLSDTAAFWSGRISKDKDKDLCCSEPAVGQKGGTTPESNKENAALQLTLGNASWRALDYKGFELDNEFKEVGFSLASP